MSKNSGPLSTVNAARADAALNGACLRCGEEKAELGKKRPCRAFETTPLTRERAQPCFSIIRGARERQTRCRLAKACSRSGLNANGRQYSGVPATFQAFISICSQIV